MIPLPETGLEAPRSEREAVGRLWWKIVPAALAGIFLAELFVHRVMGSLEFMGGKLGTALLDSSVLTLLVLPGLYFVVLRPVARLSATLSAASADARFRTIVEAAGDGILITDLKRKIHYANPATLELFGYATVELEGRALSTIIPEPSANAPEGDTGSTSASSASNKSVERDGRAKDGARIPVDFTLRALGAGEAEFLVGFVRDLRQSRRLGLFEAILPVCCGCGRIRDDSGTEHGKGAWGSLEEYVERHAATRFSHGYCAGCAAEYRRTQGLPLSA